MAWKEAFGWLTSVFRRLLLRARNRAMAQTRREMSSVVSADSVAGSRICRPSDATICNSTMSADA